MSAYSRVGAYSKVGDLSNKYGNTKVCAVVRLRRVNW